MLKMASVVSPFESASALASASASASAMVSDLLRYLLLACSVQAGRYLSVNDISAC